MSVLRRRHFKPKSLKKQDKNKQKIVSQVTDIPSLIRKYCIIKKARVKLATEPTIHAFLVSSVTRETLTYDVT